MTKKEFLEYQKTGKYTRHPMVVLPSENYELTPNQSCSVEELMKRQAAGLPLPNLTPVIHTAYNGYDLENLPASAHRGADVFDVMNDLRGTQDEIINTEKAYAVEKRLTRPKKDKNKQD